jgi:hypothetical protein
MSTYRYRVDSIDAGVVASCDQLGVSGSGKSRDEAVAALRRAIADHLGRAEAVAPPPVAPSVDFELVEGDGAAVTPS